MALLTCGLQAVYNVSLPRLAPEHVHDIASELDPGTNFGCVCTIVRARPVQPDLGAKFGQETAEKVKKADT